MWSRERGGSEPDRSTIRNRRHRCPLAASCSISVNKSTTMARKTLKLFWKLSVKVLTPRRQPKRNKHAAEQSLGTTGAYGMISFCENSQRNRNPNYRRAGGKRPHHARILSSLIKRAGQCVQSKIKPRSRNASR